jgi:hypothetical protein
MRNFYITLVLISFTAMGYSQTQNTKTAKSKEDLLNAEYAVGQPNAMQASSKAVSSEYLGFDNDIATIMLDGKIPVTFPKHQVNQSKDDYMTIMNKWIKDNSKLVKEGSKNFTFNNNQN